MKANPGGQIDIKAVVGRDPLIRQIWETIVQQSVVMTAERRIGKTTIIKKMLAEPDAGWTPVFRDFESCHTAAEFAMAVYKEIHQFLSHKGKATRRAKEWFTAMGGAEIGGLFKLPETKGNHWKDILTRAVEDLIHENDDSGAKLLFLWDEVPFMLANIPIYYGQDQKAVLLLLDELASGEGLASVKELFEMLKSSSTFDDRERLLRLLSLMERDHYLHRDSEGRFNFCFPLIRRWWKINRGL